MDFYAACNNGYIDIDLYGFANNILMVRVPIGSIYRKKSPIEGLLEHMKKVRECVLLLKEGVMKYFDEDFSSFHEITNKVSEIEHEADLIKGNIRAHLPSSILMPVDKKYFLWLLREEDAILDHAENLAQLLDLRHTKIPEELKNKFKEHMDLVSQTVEEMEKAIIKFKELLDMGFPSRIRDELKQLIHNVHRKEWEADRVRYEIMRDIYKMEDKLSPMDEYHLLKISDWVDDIADHAENVADWLRAMVAK